MPAQAYPDTSLEAEDRRAASAVSSLDQIAYLAGYEAAKSAAALHFIRRTGAGRRPFSGEGRESWWGNRLNDAKTASKP